MTEPSCYDCNRIHGLAYQGGVKHYCPVNTILQNWIKSEANYCFCYQPKLKPKRRRSRLRKIFMYFKQGENNENHNSQRNAGEL